MNAYENIMNRRSIRKYTGQPISDEDIRKILAAGMAAPSCTNARDWSFLVVRERGQAVKWYRLSARRDDHVGRPGRDALERLGVSRA